MAALCLFLLVDWGVSPGLAIWALLMLSAASGGMREYGAMVLGYVKSHMRLTHVVIRSAGHMVGVDGQAAPHTLVGSADIKQLSANDRTSGDSSPVLSDHHLHHSPRESNWSPSHHCHNDLPCCPLCSSAGAA